MTSLISAIQTPLQVTSTRQITSEAPTTSNSREALERAENQYDDFLQLLLTQLQYQDPLDPVAAEDYTSQLAQLSGVEQSIQTNENLERLISLAESGSGSSGVSYLGNKIEYPSDSAPLQSGVAEWNYKIPGNASSVTIEVSDADGNVLYSKSNDSSDPNYDPALSSNLGSYKFALSADDVGLNLDLDGNGTITETEALYEGKPLNLSVISKNSDGDELPSSITSVATVDAVDLSSGDGTVQAGGLVIKVEDITRIASS